MNENGNLGIKTEAVCKVCGDKASGKHYGVASCDGCRGFFKRSIRRNLEYVCKENGRCVVDVTRRNQCQACRFRKCLQVNMKRDAVQHERAPRTSQSHLHHYPMIGSRLKNLQNASFLSGIPLHLPSSSGAAHQAMISPSIIPGHYIPHGIFYPNLVSNFTKSTLVNSGISNSANSFSPKHLNSPFNNSHIGRSLINIKDDEVTSSEEATRKTGCSEESRCEDVTGRLELPILNELPRNNSRPLDVPYLSLFPAENVYESAAKLLFIAIKWARTIPSFLQLSYRDQSILLEESWNELFVLTSAQWALPVDEAVLIGNAMAPTTRHTALEDEARKLREIITRLTLLRVDHTEYACLKALVLFKAECRGLCEPSYVELLQDQTHVMLHEYCSQRQSSYKGRFGKLLLTLPAIQSVTRRSLEELLFKQTVGDVAIDRLLGDLAKAANV